MGPYEIVATTGAGGKGAVYRAHDRELDRDVAIKVLPDAFADDPERLARFEREAKLLASLNHPNIASIYGLVGAVLIPLNYYIIEIFDNRSMHPENLERGSLGDGMGLPFLMGNLTLFFAFVVLVIQRWDVEGLRGLRARREAEADARRGLTD